MALIQDLRGFTPSVGENTFLAETATLIGDVTVGKDCSIWYSAVLRGDVNSIIIGDRSNVQDNASLHSTFGVSITKLGNDVTIGHNAIVHGAVIGNNCLIGMGSIILDNAVIPDNTIIGAGSVVLSNAILEPGVYVGSPAKKIKDCTPAVMEAARKNAQDYLGYKDWYIL